MTGGMFSTRARTAGLESARFLLHHAREVLMLLALGVILLIAWMLGLFAFHVAGGLIHLLIVLAVISFIVHLFRRPRVV